ncbi:MAG: prenyltransferase/squalene oxidase repeat-containing protein, partial [Propionicimonas sp.]
TDAAARAAGYLVAGLVDGNHLTSDFGNESITADAVLALVAAGRDEDAAAIDAMVGYLEQQTPSYATSPEAAAKLVIVALATGKDPAAFGGTDLVAAVSAGVQADGSFGSFPGPYASGLGLIALAGTGSEIPAAMTDWLVGRADAGGGWGYEPGQPADADSTGMAILGLKALPEPTEAATAAIDAAVAWAGTARQADGSWPGFAPVNSTAVLGSALQAAGVEQPEAVAYLVGLQQADGGLPTGAEGATGSDPLATAQGTLLLAGASYLSPAPAAAAAPGWDTTNVVLWGVIAALAVGVGVAVLARRR